MEEQIIVSRIQRGDLGSLQRLVDLYQTRAVHAAYLIVSDRPVAEDIAQGAFVKVVERIQQFDSRRPFAPWFFRIVINDALKIAKKQKSRVSLDDLDESTAHLAVWLTDPGLSPEQVLEQKETRQAILQAIASLPPDQRAVVVMRYFLEMSEADMSAELDRPLSTIKWWLRDARMRLSSLLNVLR
jgi:RNA polymerase sigma-70 factor, ECF subfamily